MIKTHRKQTGFLSLVTAALIVILGFLGIAVTYMLVASTTSSLNFQLATSALYVAESGLDIATRALLTPTLTGTPVRIGCESVTGNAELTGSTAVGADTAFTVTGSTLYVSAPTTLNGALTATATTIPVVSTTGYQPMGRLMIDTELINYGGISGNSFVGVVRGVDGSTAAAHVTGVKVGQFLCNLTSVGTVSNGKRTITDSVQMQEVWAGGYENGGNYQFKRYNQPTTGIWNNATATGTHDINEISMLSYADGWAAVGNAAGATSTTNITLRWNGSAWAAGPNAPVTTTWRSVWCNSANDCHMVGDEQGSLAVLIDWNGTSWTRGSTSGFGDNSLNSVNCSATNFCWAVGTETGGAYNFYKWTGATPWTRVSVSGDFNSSFPFNSVFCNSATDCWAVGANASFARWNGGWSSFGSTMPAVQYNSVFCNATNDCWAVGNVSTNDVLVHWNGTAWTRDTSNPTPTSNLQVVACARSNDCWAVGSTSSGGILHYDGTSWSTITTTLPTGITLNALAIVAPSETSSISSQPQAGWAETFAPV